MVKQQQEEVIDNSAWELETGLPNDIDGYIVNAHFGTKDEYSDVVMQTSPDDEDAPVMFLFGLVDENGEEVAREQGYSVGRGWKVKDGGARIEHATRKNVVNVSRYGQLQKRVCSNLSVHMGKRGLPIEAKSWNGLGFHWMLEEHATVGGEAKQAIMPTVFIGEIDVSKLGVKQSPKASAAETPAAVELTEDMEEALDKLVQENEFDKFKLRAMRVPGVSVSDEIMADVMDDSESGFYARHKQ